MNHSIDYDGITRLYNSLDEEKKKSFFPGGEAQAERVISSFAYLLGFNIEYRKLLDLYIAIVVRIQLYNRTIEIIKNDYSDFVPDSLASAVIACGRRLEQNYRYIANEDKPDMLELRAEFDKANESAYREAESNWNDATEFTGFGIDPDNPIYAHMPAGSYEYLNMLYTPEFIPLTWERKGTVRSEFSSNPIDKYNLCLPNGEVFITVYVNMYSKRNSTYCPRELNSFDLDELPEKESLFSEDEEDVETAESHSNEIQNDEEAEYRAFLKKCAL